MRPITYGAAPVIGLSLGAATVGTAVPLAEAHQALSYLLAAVAAIAAVGLLFSLPIRVLPSIALAIALLLPTDSALAPRAIQGAALGVVPLAVWLVRSPRVGPRPASCTALAVLLGGWLGLSELLAPMHTNRGLEWLFSGSVALVLLVVSPPQGLRIAGMRSLLVGICTLLGLYALLEGFVLHQNILFQGLFEHTTWWPNRHNSASYRVSTLLGHPLVNGAVFATAAVLAAGEFLQSRQRSWASGARFAVLVGAMLATHSRGAALALGIGMASVILLVGGDRQAATVRRLALLVCAILGSAAILAGLQARNQSSQGQASAAVRVTVLSRASDALARLGPTGAGPGQSDSYRGAQHLAGAKVSLENSYAELAVSLGILGALLTVGLLLSMVITGFRTPAVAPEGAALLTLLVDIAGFNAIEGQRMVLVLIACLSVAILTGFAHAARHQSAEGPCC